MVAELAHLRDDELVRKGRRHQPALDGEVLADPLAAEVQVVDLDYRRGVVEGQPPAVAVPVVASQRAADRLGRLVLAREEAAPRTGVVLAGLCGEGLPVRGGSRLERAEGQLQPVERAVVRARGAVQRGGVLVAFRHERPPALERVPGVVHALGQFGGVAHLEVHGSDGLVEAVSLEVRGQGLQVLAERLRCGGVEELHATVRPQRAVVVSRQQRGRRVAREVGGQRRRVAARPHDVPAVLAGLGGLLGELLVATGLQQRGDLQQHLAAAIAERAGDAVEPRPVVAAGGGGAVDPPRADGRLGRDERVARRAELARQVGRRERQVAVPPVGVGVGVRLERQADTGHGPGPSPRLAGGVLPRAGGNRLGGDTAPRGAVEQPPRELVLQPGGLGGIRADVRGREAQLVAPEPQVGRQVRRVARVAGQANAGDAVVDALDALVEGSASLDDGLGGLLAVVGCPRAEVAAHSAAGQRVVPGRTQRQPDRLAVLDQRGDGAVVVVDEHVGRRRRTAPCRQGGKCGESGNARAAYRTGHFRGASLRNSRTPNLVGLWNESPT